MLLITGFYICVDAILATETERYVTIETNQGTVQGVVKTARNGDEYHAFLGIPYAQPPVNELRWKPPKPAPKWEGFSGGFRRWAPFFGSFSAVLSHRRLHTAKVLQKILNFIKNA